MNAVNVPTGPLHSSRILDRQRRERSDGTVGILGLPGELAHPILHSVSECDLVNLGKALKVWKPSASEEPCSYPLISHLQDAVHRRCLIVELDFACHEGQAPLSCQELFGPCCIVDARQEDVEKLDVCVLTVRLGWNENGEQQQTRDAPGATQRIWLHRNDIRKALLCLYPHPIKLKPGRGLGGSGCKGIEQDIDECSWLRRDSEAGTWQLRSKSAPPQTLYLELAAQVPVSEDCDDLEAYLSTFHWFLDPERYERRRCLRMRHFTGIFERLWDAGADGHERLLSLLSRITSISPDTGFLGFLDQDLEITEDDLDRLNSLLCNIEDLLEDTGAKRKAPISYSELWKLLWYGYYELTLRKRLFELQLRPMIGAALYRPIHQLKREQDAMEAECELFYQRLEEL